MTVKGGSWIYDSELKKLVPRSEYRRPESSGPDILKSNPAFISPIDGSEIRDRKQLKDHNRRHGVTDARDYSAGYYKDKAFKRQEILRGDSKAATNERKQALSQALSNYERTHP